MVKPSVKYCSIGVSTVITNNLRLEATMYDIDGIEAKEIISKYKYGIKKLTGDNGLATAYTCSRFKRPWVTDETYPIYQPSSIVDLYPKPDGFIANTKDVDLDKLIVHKNQILLTCSGTIGKIALVSDTLNNKIFSHDLLRIDCINPLDIGLVYTYLKTDLGQKNLLRNRYGAVVNHIESEHLDDVLIPNTPEQLKRKLNELIMESYRCRDEANQLLDDATSLLEYELNISDDLFKTPPLYTDSVPLSQLFNRIDASNHLPLYDKIKDHLVKNAIEVIDLGDKSITKEIGLPTRFKRNYVEKEYGFKFIGGKQINELNPSTSKYLSMNGYTEKLKSSIITQPNTIWITRSGTIGKTNLVCDYQSNWIASDHIVRIVSNNSNIAGYLWIYLQTKCGQAMIKQHIYGSVVLEIDNNQIASVPVPIVKEKVMENIAKKNFTYKRIAYKSIYLRGRSNQHVN